MKPGIAGLIVCWLAVACGAGAATSVQLSLAQSYHLRTVDGVSVPFATSGGTLDSGSAIRHGTDSLLINIVIRGASTNGAPPVTVIQVNDCRATQTGSTVLLFTVYSSTPDTAFLSNDTLTVHSRSGGPLHVDVYVAP